MKHLGTAYRVDTGEGVVEYRVDARRYELRAPVKDASGFLRLEGVAAVEGVLEYRRQDGTTRRELVTNDTLRRMESDDLVGKPVTLRHPGAGRVTPRTAQALSAGTVVGSRVEGGARLVDMSITRADAIDAIEAGDFSELSPGYIVELDETPGIHEEHGRYDAVQTSRQYNHLALCEPGTARGGAACSIRTDQEIDMREALLRLLRSGGMELADDASDEALTEAAGKMASKLDEMKESEDMADEKEDMGHEEKEKEDEEDDKRVDQIARLQAQLDAMPTEEQRKQERQTWYQRRKRLDALASSFRIDGVDGLDNDALTVRICEAKYGDRCKADQPAAYYAGLLDVIETPTERVDARELHPSAAPQAAVDYSYYNPKTAE